MANTVVPNINASICSQWTQQDINLYNTLPFYLVKMQLKYFKNFSIWPDFCGKVKWQPNMGPIMRQVSKEPSPNIRQFAFPNAVCSVPLKDIMDVRERTVDAQVLRHRFESMVLNFCPSFRDFLKDHVDRTNMDIVEKIARFHNVFIRGNVYVQSPYVMLPNRADGKAELTTAPTDIPTDTFDSVNQRTTFTANATPVNGAKDMNWMQAQFPLIGNPGNLSLNTVNLSLNIMETDLRIPPFFGDGQPQGDNAPLSGKYVLVTSGEAYNQFIYDPFFLSYKALNLDMITAPFKGSLFGRITCRLEDLPIRISLDGSFPTPEVRELNPNAFNYGESVPNPNYTSAPYEVAFLVGYGDGAYDTIEVGPPPKDFAGNGMPKGFGNMFWNAETIITKNLLTTCLDSNGNTVVDTNKYGEFLQIIAQGTFGIVGKQKRGILPIIFKRWRGATKPVLGN
jgi:hypothetical protein